MSTMMTAAGLHLANSSDPPVANKKTLLSKLIHGEAPAAIDPTQQYAMIEDLRRLYQLADILTPEQHKIGAPTKEKPFRAITTDALPEGFIPMKTNAEPFDIVGGRLGLALHQPNYKVTPEEMRRRIEGVEKLNSSNIAINLKRAKLKNGGEIMRKQLLEHGIRIDLNKHRNEAASRIIAMTEAESIHLGSDLETICHEEYPVGHIAEEVVSEATDAQLIEALADNAGFVECMSAMEDAFKTVVPPMSGVVPVASKNKNLNYAQEKLSCATHGLGIVTQRVWAHQMKRIGEQMTEVLEKKKKKVNAPSQ